ncbi:unnamed protein product [Mytilus coruscus]|uniref:Uncharacterized protein n=1 Tax=Mytilus coruscus TaxID=42192 RepID=A0A6J8EVN0_MYTCO|nr:unnamed protein product [Mytilus coruscus]
MLQYQRHDEMTDFHSTLSVLLYPKETIDASTQAGASGIGSSLGINDRLIEHVSSAGTGAKGRRQSVSGIISSSSSMSSVMAGDDGNCNYVCGQGKSCPLGHTCVHEGCRSYCVESSVVTGSSVFDIIRSSSSGMSSGIRDGSRLSSECDYVYRGGKPCPSGYKCIHEGFNSYCIKSSESMIGIPSLSQSLTGRISISEIIRSSSSEMASASSGVGRSNSKCVYECGVDKLCASGYKCV